MQMLLRTSVPTFTRILNLDLPLGAARTLRTGLALAALLFGLAAAGSAQANYLVNSAADSTAGVASNCPANSTLATGSCRLRDAVAAANGNTAGNSAIAFSSAVTGTAAAPLTITLTAGALTLSTNVTVTGPGANLLSISGNNASRILQVSVGVTATVSGLTLTKAYNDTQGGAVFNQGTLTLSDAAVTNSVAAFGGGVENLNGGVLVLRRVTLSGNLAAYQGGGLYQTGGSVTILDSTISGNRCGSGAGTRGGGLSSLNGNAGVTLVGTTVTANTCANEAGGIDGAVTFSNSIVAGNFSGASGLVDFDAAPVDGGGNVFSSGSGTLDPVLAPLGFYGGSTQTQPPLPGSPALCAGLVSADQGTATDQRGATHSTAYCTQGTQLDSGAIQTSYSAIAFAQQPSNVAVGNAISPSPTLVLTENGTTLITGASLSMALSTAGDYAPYGQPTLNGTLAATTSAGAAAFSNLRPSQAASNLRLSASAAITPGFSLSSTSTPFAVGNPSIASNLYSTVTDNVASRPFAGATVTLTATTTNLGAQTFSPTLVVTLPAGLSSISIPSTSGDDTCFPSSATSPATITCPPVSNASANFYSASSVSVTIQATVTATDAIGTTIAVTAHASDINGDAGNTATDTLTLTALTVNTLADDAIGTPANCTTTGGACTLRDALAAANGAGGTASIPVGFAPALAGTQASPNTITLVNGQLEISGNVTLTGPGADLLSISGNNTSRVLQVDSGATANLSGLTFTKGNGTGVDGGAIANLGTLNLTDSTISNSTTNHVAGGGGVFSSGLALTLSRVAVLGNNSGSPLGGGGVAIAGGTLVVTDSTFAGNTVSAIGATGGGIFYNGSSTSPAFTLVNSTITGNSSRTDGGGIQTGNLATLTNSIVEGNTASNGHADVYGTYTDDGGNLVNGGASATSTYTASTLLLSPLGFYGGHTMTMLALPGSPALCAGVQAGTASGNTYTLPPYDQRGTGFPRTTRYTPTTCVDSGAAQTRYSLAVTAPANGSTVSPGTAITPAPAVSLLESGNAFAVSSSTGNTVTLTPQYGTVTGNTTNALAGGSYSFPNAVLTTNSATDGFTYTLPLTATGNATAVNLATSSSRFNVVQTVSPAQSSVVASPTSLSTGATTTITVTVKNASGSPIQNASVTITGTGSPNFFGAATTYPTNAGGQVPFNVTDATAETDTFTVTVTVDGTSTTLTSTLQVTFTQPTFTVTTTADNTTGACTQGSTADAACTLRAAVAAANAIPNGGALVNFAPGLTGTITLANGQLELMKSITITGPAANLLTVSGNLASRVLQVDSSVTANISGLTFTKGNGTGATNTGNGGAIENLGTLNLSSSTVSGSTAPNGNGGGIDIYSGSATLTSVSILGNTAVLGAGVSAQAPLTVVNSLISGNTAGINGGGIYYNAAAAKLILSSTTITGNQVTDPSGAGGGFYANNNAVATLTNTIVAGNTANYVADVASSYTDNGGNVATGGNPGKSTYTAATLKLAPLGYYGGATQTMPPLPGSPAICAGLATGTNGQANPATDQRGFPQTNTYCTASQLDSGSVQTFYSVLFPGGAFTSGTQPGASFVDQNITGPPAVALLESNTPFTAAPVTVNFALVGNGTLSNTTATTSTSSNIATLTASISAPSTADYLDASVTVTSTGVTTPALPSKSFTVTGPANHAVFTTPPPTPLAAGSSPGIIVLQEEDAAGNPTNGSTDVDQLTVESPTQTIAYQAPATAQNGIVSFNLSALKLTVPGTYTYIVQGYGMEQAIEVVIPGATTQLTVSGFQNPTAIQQPGSLTVTAKDASGNVMTGFTGTVTLSSTDAAATGLTSYTFTASDAGTHTFTGLALATPGTESITATTGSITGLETGIVVTGSTWIVNNNGTVSRLNGVGTLLATTGTAGAASPAGGIAIDSTGDAWAVTTGANTLVEAGPAGTLAGAFTGGGLSAPAAVAIDGLGQVWVANAGNSVSAFTSTGSAISPSTGGYGATSAGQPTPYNAPSGIAIDQAGSIWVTNSGNSTVTRIFGGAAPVVAPLVTGTTNSTTGTRP